MAIVDFGTHTIGTAPTIIGVTDKPYVWVRALSHPQGIVPFGTYLIVQTQDRVNALHEPRQLIRVWADLNGTTLNRVTLFKLLPDSGVRRRLLISTPNGGDLTIAVNAQDASDLAIP